MVRRCRIQNQPHRYSGDIETWLYIKHNNTHMYIGLVVWQIYVNAYDEFTLFFDKGNNSIYGSGTRDYNLTVNQEDLKSCTGTNETSDGCYLTDPTQFQAFTVEINFTAKSLLYTEVLFENYCLL